jgi:hypothetical protein
MLRTKYPLKAQEVVKIPLKINGIEVKPAVQVALANLLAELPDMAVPVVNPDLPF